MISNERVRRLIAVDRETLIALMAFARADGAMSGGLPELWHDADVRSLMEQARRESRVSTRKALDHWNEWAGRPEQG